MTTLTDGRIMRVIGARDITNRNRKHYGSTIQLTVEDIDGRVFTTDLGVWLPYGAAVNPDDYDYDDHYESQLEAKVVSKIINAIVEPMYDH